MRDGLRMQVLSYLSKSVIKPSTAPLFIDGCAGLGGHSLAVLQSVPTARILCIDRDPSVGCTCVHRSER